VWSSIGSTNLDWRSFLHNDEVNAVILGPEFAQQMQAMFERDLAASTAITAEAWARRPLRFKLKELMSRIWQYWL
jgi:cardiolipin synthase